MKQTKKPFYKRFWFIILVIIIVIAAYGMAKSAREAAEKAAEKSAEQSTEYIWPDSTLAGMIPQPDSKYGKVTMENESLLDIDIYKISKDQFEAYISSCKDSGFTVDYTKMDKYYSAENEDGYSLSLSYNSEEKILNISISAPDDESDIPLEDEQEPEDLPDEGNGESSKASEEPDEPEEEKNEESKNKDSDDIRPEFKELLDDYEDFMDKYCDFLEEYNESDGDISMLGKYNELMQEYIEFVEKIDALGEETMNDAEAKYYLDVTLRVAERYQKL